MLVWASLEAMDYNKLLDALEELYAEYEGFTKERRWAELREDINALREWMMLGMVEECPIEPDEWLTPEQLAELED
jgi:hypothetical protein